MWCFSNFTVLTSNQNKHGQQLLAKNRGPGEAFAMVFCGVPEVALPVLGSVIVIEPACSRSVLLQEGPVEGETGPLPSRRPHCWLAACKITFHPIAG